MISSKSPTAEPRVRGVGTAALWATSGPLLGRVFDIAALVFLARSLSPADFGIVAMAMTVVLLIEAITQIPLVQPILRSPEPDARHYDTAFTLGALRAVAISVAIAGSSTLVAKFYGEPRLALLLVALAVAPAFRGLTSPRIAEAVRRYDLRPDFLMIVSGKFVALVLVVVTLEANRSYWALAIGTIATPVIMCLISYAVAPYRPRFSLAAWSEFSDIVGWNSLTQILSAVNYQLDRMILGRVTTPADLGRFSMATDICSLPLQALIQPMNVPLVAAFAKATDDAERGRLWLASLNAILFVLGPIYVAVALLAEPMVRLLLGPHWIDMVQYVILIALILLGSFAIWLLPPLALVLYRADLPTKRMAVALALRLPVTVGGVVVAGPLGAIAGRAVGTAAEVVLTFRGSRTLTGLAIRAQLWSLRRTAAGVAAFGAATALTAPIAPEHLPTLAARLELGGRMGLAVGAGASAMALVMLGLWFGEGRPTGIERRIGHSFVQIWSRTGSMAR